MRQPAAHLLAFLSLCLAAVIHAAEPPLVAVTSAVLQKKARGNFGDSEEKEAAPLAERVQIALEADPAPGHRFVERIALDALVREQSLSLAGALDHASAVRTGRLLHADWILRLRLRADDTRPRVEAEVIDALRADLLGRAETPLAALPDESWLLQPSDAAVEIARASAVRALAAARARTDTLAGRTILAPLSFIDRDPSGRLAPLGRMLHSALHADHPGVRVLGYERPDGAMNEPTLFQAGMTDLSTADWAGVADVFLWGEYLEDPARKAGDPPVLLRLWLWRDGATPRMRSFRGDYASLETLAREAASTVLDAAVGGRMDATEETRSSAARRLIDAAAVLAPPPGMPWDKSPPNLARQQTRLSILTLAAFFAPENPLLREQVSSLGVSLAPDDSARAIHQRQFWRTIDQFLTGPDGGPNLPLLARAGHYDANFPGYPARFERIGRILAAHPLDDTTTRQICDRFAYAAAALPREPGLAAAQAAMQPALLADPDRWRERMQARLQAGGDVNHRSAKWGTTLRLALIQNDPDQVVALLAAGADPSVKPNAIAIRAYDGPDFDVVATPLYNWFALQRDQRERDGPPPPQRDEAALRFLPVFWPHDKAGNVREDMLKDAEKAGLPRAAAWMRAHLRD